MNELQLVGYTADLRYIVFTDASNGAVRYKAPVDADLIATMDEVTHLVDPDRKTPPATVAPQVPPAADAPPQRVVVGKGPLAVAGLLAEAAVTAEGEDAPAPARGSKLSPREIQALLRSGKAPSVVARMAETDESWVERWLAPIEAERAQVLLAVQQARLTKARLGPSRDTVGEAVRRNLAGKGLRPDDESVQWRVSRRNGTDEWTVELRYRSRGRRQRAVWSFDPENGAIDPRNDLALEIAWTRSRRSRTADEGGPTPRKAPRKAAAKKQGAKTGGAKKAVTETASGRKATAKKSTAKKSTAKKSTARTSTARKSTAKPATAKKSTARKAAGGQRRP